MRPSHWRCRSQRLEKPAEYQIPQRHIAWPRPFFVDETKLPPIIEYQVVGKHVDACARQPEPDAIPPIPLDPQGQENLLQPDTQPFRGNLRAPAIPTQITIERPAPCPAANVDLIDRLETDLVGGAKLRAQAFPGHTRNAIFGLLEGRFFAELRQPLDRIVVCRPMTVDLTIRVLRSFGMRQHHERVGHIRQQPVLQQGLPCPVHGEQGIPAKIAITRHRSFGQGNTAIKARHRISIPTQHHAVRKLVIGERQRQRRLGITGIIQHPDQLGPSVSTGTTIFIQVPNADHRAPEVVLGSTGEVLESQLVFNGEKQHPPGVEQGACLLQPMQSRIRAITEPVRVFKHADHRHRIEFLSGFAEFLQIVDDDLDILQLPAPCGRNAGTPRGRLQRDNAGGGFAKVTGDGTAACSDFKHAPCKEGRKRAQQIGALGAEVITRRPVDNPVRKLGRQDRTIGACFHHVEKRFLDRISVGIAPSSIFSWHDPATSIDGIFIFPEKHFGVFHCRTLILAPRSVMPMNSSSALTHTWILSYRRSWGITSPETSRLAIPSEMK